MQSLCPDAITRQQTDEISLSQKNIRDKVWERSSSKA